MRNYQLAFNHISQPSSVDGIRSVTSERLNEQQKLTTSAVCEHQKNHSQHSLARGQRSGSGVRGRTGKDHGGHSHHI